MHPKERSVFTLANFYECDIGKQLSFFSKLSIADLGPDKYELITETGSHFSKKHHSHHTLAKNVKSFMIMLPEDPLNAIHRLI